MKRFFNMTIFSATFFLVYFRCNFLLRISGPDWGVCLLRHLRCWKLPKFRDKLQSFCHPCDPRNREWGRCKSLNLFPSSVSKSRSSVANPSNRCPWKQPGHLKLFYDWNSELFIVVLLNIEIIFRINPES